MRECPFCKISTEKSRMIKETEFSRVIFSNPRLMLGHLLVVPKRHVEKLSELSEEERNDIWDLVSKFQEKILKNISSGCDIRQNYRPFQKEGKLKVHHLHFHLQPRELFDELYEKCQKYETKIFKNLSQKEIDKVLRFLNK